ncbi:hypothetical protein QOT17_009930 [Balamuthia mandrillaris]
MRSPSPWLVATILLLFLGDTIHSAHAIQVDSATPLFRFVNHLNQLVWEVVFQRVDNVDYDYVRAWLVSSVGAQGGSLTIPQVLGTGLNVTAQHDATTNCLHQPPGSKQRWSVCASGKTLLLNVLDNPKKWDIKFLLSKADSTVVPTAITSWAGDRNPSDMLNISLPYDIFFVAVYLTESQVPKQGDNIPFSSLDLRFVRDVYTNAGQEPAVDLVYYKDSWYLNVSNSYCAQQQECKACLKEGNTPLQDRLKRFCLPLSALPLWAIIALLALQCGYLFFVCLVMPCATYASFLVEVLQSLTLITEMALVFFFIGNPQFPLLLVVSLLPLVMMLVCLVLVPLIASFIRLKQEDEGLYLPINDPPSS